jgi:1,4-dihydroxy-2-naphthoyl-CoA synthase
MTLYQELRERGARDGRELVEVEPTGERAIVTMNEPERLNPLSVGLNLQLQERLTELAADAALRAIVLTGADPAFSTGGDLEMMAGGNAAALNGTAAGVGLAWALACDVVVASERAVLVPAFGRLGLVPEVGTSGFSPAGSATTVRSRTTYGDATSAPRKRSSSGWSKRSAPMMSCARRRRSGARAPSGSPRTRSR